MWFKIPVLLLVSLTIFGCCNSKHITSNEKITDQNYKKLAEEKYRNNYNILINPDSSHIIVYSKIRKENLSEPPLKYFIYNLQKNVIVFEDNLPNGDVGWIDNSLVKVSIIPGIVKGDEEENSFLHGYIYDISLNKKISKPKSDNN